MKAVYAGSFDPLTNGHLDIIKRAAKTFPKLIVAVANNSNKKSLLSPKERVELIELIAQNAGVEVQVDSFDGLLVDYCRSQEATVIVRGLRAVSDYEYESQLAITNRQLDENIETTFFMTSKDCSFISSRIVKEIASFGGDVSALVPQEVVEKLKTKFS